MRALRRSRFDLVSLDEMHRRLIEGDTQRRFICVTIDDGYRDTMQWAYPILQRYEAPFAIYIPTSFPDRLGELWWLALEAVVARNKRITLLIDGAERGFECASISEKWHLYDQLYGWVRSFKTEEELRQVVRDLSGALPGRYRGVLRGTLHGLGRTSDARRRPAGDDRRPYRQPRDAGQGHRERPPARRWR